MIQSEADAVLCRVRRLNHTVDSLEMLLLNSALCPLRLPRPVYHHAMIISCI